jgi:4-hydroxy-4-methyl-2-oxoglutarate aldolase
MSTVAKMRGATGCICDSQIRDCIRIKELGFPVFYKGIRPQDSKGRGIVMAYDVPVKCGDVLVHPGDIIIPKGVEEELYQRAKGKVHAENLSRKELLEGKTLREVYDKYGAL